MRTFKNNKAEVIMKGRNVEMAVKRGLENSTILLNECGMVKLGKNNSLKSFREQVAD